MAGVVVDAHEADLYLENQSNMLSLLLYVQHVLLGISAAPGVPDHLARRPPTPPLGAGFCLPYSRLSQGLWHPRPWSLLHRPWLEVGCGRSRISTCCRR
jgi:hypothetical protein